MKVYIAKHGGFCVGVRRAVDMAKDAAKERGRVYSLGKLIHNEGVVEELRGMGVIPIDSLESVGAGDVVVVRAHGESKAVMRELQRKGVHIVDATCPFVAKIHRIAESAGDVPLIVAGQAKHPEVVGICGWASGESYVVESVGDVLKLPHMDAAILVSQTTGRKAVFDEIADELSRRVDKLVVHMTICKATQQRQREAETLSRFCTRMFIIGSETSANVRALAKVCEKSCKYSRIIDNIDKIPLAILEARDIIGFVAGASAPDVIIMEVIQVMSELENATVETIEAEAPAEVVAEATEIPEVSAETEAVAEPAVEEEAAAEEAAPAAVTEPDGETEAVQVADNSSDDFRKAFEGTMRRIRPGQVLTGTVLQLVDGEIYVNIGYKSDGVIPKGEFSTNPDMKVEDVIKEGDSIDVEVVKVNDGEGNVLLSHKNVESKKLWDELMVEGIEEKVFDAVGKEVVKGGLIAEIDGNIRAFIPASLVSTKYVENLSEYVGKPIKVMVLEVDRGRKRVVASAKKYLLTEQERKLAEKWDSIIVGSKVHGVVRRITDFGAFVDIGGVDGLVHVTDTAWGRVKHPSDTLSIGQEIEVLVLGVDKDKKRISLGYKQLQPKPWTMAAEKYPVGKIVEGKVVRIVPFGAFVALEPTIDGLIHISQIALRRIEKVEDELKVGDVVRCKVLEVNPEAKRISLSRRDATLEENPEIAAQLAAEKAERERLYQERKAQREADREQQQQPRQPRNNDRGEQRQSRSGEQRPQSAPRPAGDSRPDRRRRNNEDGDYELPPVSTTTTSLASLLANFKAEDDE